MTKYEVTGMSCAACAARIEKAVGKVEGVESCAVSLLTNSMGVEGSASPEAVIRAVEEAGYGASPERGGASADAASPGASPMNHASEEALKDRETPALLRRLLASLAFLLVLMYFSMGHMMWGFPLPPFFEGNHIAMGLIQLLLTMAVMVINQKFFVNGARSMLHLAPNMDALVALGAAAAFGYSVFALFAMSAEKTPEAMKPWMEEFYFESAAMILTLITVGKMLEARSKGRTTDALKGLMKLAPQTAVLLRDGKEETVPIAQVKQGDLFVVRPGESIPVDGVVEEGVSAVNEAALTGESIPVDKEKGDSVSAATLNQSGFLTCRATRVGEDTTLSQIIRMVSDAAQTKAPIAKIADTVSGIFVPAVIGIAALTFIVWMLIGETVGFSLARAISVLVISCPCALGLATPVAIMVGNGVGAKNGILFKTAASLEETGRISAVTLDKTGTITKGEPGVTDILPAEGSSEERLLMLAAALEKRSEHPLARAILERAGEMALPEITGFTAVPGKGLTGMGPGGRLLGGKAEYLKEEGILLPEAFTARAAALSAEGKTPLYFAEGDKLLGVIGVADLIKEESPEAIAQLKALGLSVVMLTGDNEKTARAIGERAGVSEVVAGVLPDGKEKEIRALKEKEKTAMVGDGINDAPALTRADIGIAIGAGTDIAIDAADVVLMKSSLLDVPAAIRLSRATLRNIHENLFWAFIYNVIGIPLAAGVFIPLLGWRLNPMFGAAAMSLSSFCVVTNALRLNLFNLRDASRFNRKRGVETAAGETVSAGAGRAGETVSAGAEKIGETVSAGAGRAGETVSAGAEKAGKIVSAGAGKADETVSAGAGRAGEIVSASAGGSCEAVSTGTKLVNGNAAAGSEHGNGNTMIDQNSQNRNEEASDSMEKTINIEGMMCAHCENTVKKALEAIDGVESAAVSHEDGKAVVRLSADVSEQALKEAVEAKEYKVLGFA